MFTKRQKRALSIYMDNHPDKKSKLFLKRDRIFWAREESEYFYASEVFFIGENRDLAISSDYLTVQGKIESIFKYSGTSMFSHKSWRQMISLLKQRLKTI